ncbi:hypothetical protein C0J52_24607 [Blattella germanica]|nr:hypothetical protein C0J52_24607 [Blattella germanica]
MYIKKLSNLIVCNYFLSMCIVVESCMSNLIFLGSNCRRWTKYIFFFLQVTCMELFRWL